MKYIFLFVLALVFAGCNKASSDIEFNGIATGMQTGTIIIKDQTTNDPVFTASIDAEKFHINKQILTQKGYFDLVILTGGKPHKFEIYLEPGSYTIKIDKDKINDYPDITTVQPGMQNDITAYNLMAQSITTQLRQEVRDLNEKMNSPEVAASTEMYNDIATRITALIHKIEEQNIKSLEDFVNKYPKNRAAAHIMAKLSYTDEPERFYKIYSKFSDEVKKSDEGKAIAEKLNGILNFSKQGNAPQLAGNTPDGQTINLKKLNAKLVLVEFWRSDSELSRSQHQALVLNPLPGYQEKQLAIISVSMNTKREDWLKAIKEDKMDWIQVSDLKGNDSPNADKWGITSLPSFYLIDADGKFIEREVPFNNLKLTISSYLEKH